MGVFEVYRGKKNIHDVGKVHSFDGGDIDQWPMVDEDDECNQYYGTDSTIFPPLITPGEPLSAFDPAVCRSLFVTFIKNSKYAGIKTQKYGIDFDHKLNARECFCRDPPDGCPPPGTFDLYHCVKVPIFGSLPHFYEADPKLLEKIGGGLNPNEQEHGIVLEFETVIM